MHRGHFPLPGVQAANKAFVFLLATAAPSTAYKKPRALHRLREQTHLQHQYRAPQLSAFPRSNARFRLACKAQSGPQEDLQQQRNEDTPEVTSQPASLRGPSVTKFLAALFIAGAILGPLLDGIHGTVELNIYDSLPFSIAGLHSSAWVPPLLGSFYAIAGSIIVALDWLATSEEPISGLGFLTDPLRTYGNVQQTCDTRAERTTLSNIALATGALAYLLELSANLYGNGVGYPEIHAALALSTALNWLAFDGTRQGVILAVICAIVAPASELVIMKFGLWHYPKPDLLGLPTWVAWCYAFYAPALSNLARSIWIWADE